MRTSPNRFSKQNQPVKCQGCGKLTAHKDVPLCPRCFDLAGLENEHNDGGHEPGTNAKCPLCKDLPKPV